MRYTNILKQEQHNKENKMDGKVDMAAMATATATAEEQLKNDVGEWIKFYTPEEKQNEIISRAIEIYAYMKSNSYKHDMERHILDY
jgi:hypothetical protein